MALTDIKHEAFAQAYVDAIGNGAEAARRCGVDDVRARQTAWDWLQREEVRDRIDELAAARLSATRVTAENVLSELHRIANVNPRDAFDPLTNALLNIHDMPEDVQRAISSIKVEELFEGSGKGRRQAGWTKEVKFWTKTQALEMLARTLALFKDSLTIKTKEMNEIDENSRAARVASLFEVARQRRERGDDLA